MAFYQPPNKKMVEAINNIGKVCPMGLEFKPALCKTKHFIAKAKRKKGKLIDFNFCEKCELVMNMIAEEKNKQTPEKPVTIETVKPQHEIDSEPAAPAVKKTQKSKNTEKCPTCNISYSIRRKIKGVCVNCYERNRRKSKRKEQLKKPDILELLELIDKKCAAVNKKIIRLFTSDQQFSIVFNELIKEKYDLLTAKRVLSGINKELENVN